MSTAAHPAAAQPTQPQQASEPTQPQQQDSGAADTPPAWATRLVERIDALEGRASDFGRDLGRIRGKLRDGAGQDPAPGQQGDAQPQPQPQQGISQADIVAAMRFGELKARLPDDARKHLDERLADGASFDELAREAELITKFSKASEPATGSAPRIPGHAATAAQPTGASSYSMSDLLEMSRADPERFRRVMADPNSRVPGMR